MTTVAPSRTHTVIQWLGPDTVLLQDPELANLENARAAFNDTLREKVEEAVVAAHGAWQVEP